MADTDDMKPPGAQDQDPVEEALVGCLEETVSEWKKVVQRACQAHPQIEDQIKARVQILEGYGLLSRDVGEQAAGQTPSSSGISDDGQLGHYRIIKELGRGGQAVVYLAQDERLDRRVALKVLQASQALSERSMERFRREAQAVSRLDHPGICAVYEADTIDGTPVIAMRHIDGSSFRDVIANSLVTQDLSLETRGDQEFIEISDDTDDSAPTSATGTSQHSKDDLLGYVKIVEQVAQALHVAHESGLVHRDIKPGNIMITTDGEPVILDFGLAQDENAGDVTLTQTGDLLGTPAYMSPEQLLVQRIPIDRRTDVYSLGVVLFEALTSRRPFDAPTRVKLYEAILSSDPPDIRKLNSNIPVDLKVVVETALEKNRDKRFQTALDFAEELGRIRRLEPIQSRPIGTGTRFLRWCQRHPTRAIAAVLLIVIASLGAYSMGKSREADLERANVALAEKENDRVRRENEALEARTRGDNYMEGLMDTWISMSATGMYDPLKTAGHESLKLYRSYGIPLDDGRPIGDVAQDLIRAAEEDKIAGPHILDAVYLAAASMIQFGFDLASQLDDPGPPDWASPDEIKNWNWMRETYPDQVALLGRLNQLIDLVTSENDPWGRELWKNFLHEHRTHDGSLWDFIETSKADERSARDMLNIMGCVLGSMQGASVPQTFKKLKPFMDIAARKADHTVEIYMAHLFRGILGRVQFIYGLIPPGKGNMQESVHDLEICAALRPLSLYTWCELARAHMFNGNEKAAESSFARAHGLVDSHGETLFVNIMHGDALFHTGRTSKARKIFERLLDEKDPHAEWYRIVGNGREYDGDWEGALEAYDKTLELDQGNQSALSSKASILYRQGRLKSSRDCWQRVTSLNSRSLQGWQSLARINFELKEYDKALDACSKALSLPSSEEVWAMKARIQIAAGDIEGLRKTLEIVETSYGDNAEAVRSMAVIIERALGEEDKHRIIPLYKRALTLEPDNIRSLTGLVDTLYDQGEYEEALTFARQLVGLIPMENGKPAPGSDADQVATSFKVLGDSLLAIGKTEEAASALRQSLDSGDTSTARSSASTWNRLSTALLRLGRVQESLKAAEQAVELRNSAWNQEALGAAQFAAGDFDAAEVAYNKVVSISSGETVPAFPGMAYVLWAQGARLDALDLAREQMENDPDNMDRHRSLIGLQLRSFDPASARETINQALEKWPDSPWLQLDRGDLELVQWRPREAIAFYEKSRDLNRDSNTHFRGIAWARLALGEAADAEREARRGLSTDRHSPHLKNLLGRALMEQGRMQEARSTLEASLEAHPTDDDMVGALAIIVLHQGDLKGTRKLLQKGLSLAERNGFNPEIKFRFADLVRQVDDIDGIPELVLGLQEPVDSRAYLRVAVAAFYRREYRRTMTVFSKALEGLDETDPKLAPYYEMAAKAAARLLRGEGWIFEPALPLVDAGGKPLLDADGRARYALPVGHRSLEGTVRFSERPAIATKALDWLNAAMDVRSWDLDTVEPVIELGEHRVLLGSLVLDPELSVLALPPTGSPWADRARTTVSRLLNLLKEWGALEE